MTIHLHKDDLPDGLDMGAVVAIDCEAMGLHPHRDRLCVVQLSGGDGDAHLVQVSLPIKPAPNLCRLLADPDVLKLFHFGRFDIALLAHSYGVTCRAGLLHQDRIEIGAHLYRPARAEIPSVRIAGRRYLQAAAKL